MHDILHAWAAEHRIHPHAIAALLQRLGVGYTMDTEMRAGMSEAAVQQRVRLAASQAGILAWRNNVGAMQDESGRVVRFGLCNDTKQLNESIKSADLIGIKPVLITQAMVGTWVGQFWSREVKESDWSWKGDDHELAQLKWLELIMSKGGDAAFTTGTI